VVRGWCGYFRPGVSCATFAYLGHYLWFRSGTGCAANTPRPPGSRSAAATSAADRGRPATTGYCSTPPRSAPAATAAGAQPSRPPGRPPP